MSEPMSSGEIEDVLSSIKRLVSEDLRPVAKDIASAGRADDGLGGAKPLGAEGGSKLLLTPALRVVSTQVSTLTEPRVEALAADILPEDAEPEPESNARIETGAETGDADDAHEAQTAFDSAAEDEDWLPESGEETEAYPGWAQADDVAPPESEMSRVVHEIAAGVSESDDDWEPETGDAPLAAVSWQAPEWVEEAKLVDDEASVETGTGTRTGDGTVAARKAIADLAEGSAVAQIMARAAKAKTESDGRTAGETSAETQQLKASTEAESGAENDIFAEDEGYFDETVLRDLVRDLIREELSGTLGERITRNVRKLVRAEINRALTARDFD